MYLFYFFLLSETETVNIQAVDVFNFELEEDAKIPPVSYFHFLSNINLLLAITRSVLMQDDVTSMS